MRKLSHYEQRWRDSRESVVADVDSDESSDDAPPAAEVSGEPEPASDEVATSDPTEDEATDVVETVAGADDRPGESRADRRKRLKRERAERREPGGGS